jgi:WD40 repeat protein
MQDEFEAEPSSTGGVACLAWTTSPFDSPMMVVGGGSTIAKVCIPKCSSVCKLSGLTCYLQIWGYSASRKWTPLWEFTGHAGRVHDVAWAPNIGRSYHLIATAGADGKVGLWKINVDPDEGTAGRAPSSSVIAAGATWAVKPYSVLPTTAVPVSAFDEHNNLPVWRVEFNVTGTVLASSADDGTLRLRRQNLSGAWETVASIDTQAPLPSTSKAVGSTGTESSHHNGSAVAISAWAHAPAFDTAPRLDSLLHAVGAGGFMGRQAASASVATAGAPPVANAGLFGLGTGLSAFGTASVKR